MSLSPEQIAKQIVDDYLISRSMDDRELEDAIVAALREERERAALIAEETTRAPMNYIGWSPGPAADDRARRIATAIRAP